MAIIRCGACGAECDGGVKFCGVCGAPMENAAYAEDAAAPVTPAAPASAAAKLDLKKFIIPAAVAVAAIIAIAVCVNVFKPAKYEKMKGSVYIGENDDKVVIIPNGKSKTEIPGYEETSVYSADGTTAYAVIEEEDSDGYTLYFIDGSPKSVDTGVDRLVGASRAGGAIVYAKNYDYTEDTADLWICSEGKTKLVAKEASAYGNVAISPDGKTVSYCKDRDDNVTAYIWDGKEKELGKDIDVIAVSNGGKYVYYRKNDSVYVQRGTNSDKKEKLCDYYDDFFFNKDYSQAVFNYNGKAYITRNGGKREAVGSQYVSAFITPANSTGVGGCAGFANTFFRGDDGGVYRIDGKYKSVKVAGNVESVYLASDGKTLTYQKGNGIYTINGANANAKAVQTVNERVYGFIAAESGGAVFFRNEDDELVYQKGRGKPAVVSDDVSDAGEYLYKGTTLFYISDGELYRSTGGKGARVSGPFEGDVRGVRVGYCSVYVTSRDGSDTFVYYSTDGKKFELVSGD